jgi:glutathione synthase/RimK-type ligase-like ATP-grasp enzyme
MIVAQKLDTAELLFQAAIKMGLRPRWLMPNQLFVVDTLLGERYIHEARSTINSQLGSSLSCNKTATRHILEQHGLPSIPFLQTTDPAAASRFLAEHTKIIVKPIRGSNSRDVRVVESAGQLEGVDLSKYILEKYIAGKEMRYLILDGQVIGVHHSGYGESVSEDRSLERVSYAEAEWDPELVALSLQVGEVFGLRFAAIDYIIEDSGRAVILEANSSPGMKWFHAPSAGPPVNVAQLFLEAMFSDEYVRTPILTAQ